MASNGNCSSFAGSKPSIETWENLKICMFQKSGVLIVRESPQMNSETSKQFFDFEDKLNKKYLRKFAERECIPYVVPEIGEDVIVLHDNKCYRGLIKDRIFEKFSEYASVYLVDYGNYVDAAPSMIYHMHSESDKTCAAVTHQAKYIMLQDVSAMSLDYTLDSGELKLLPRAAATWDDSAIKFLNKLIDLAPLAHFHCLSERVFEGNSIYYGHLYVDMTEAVILLTQIHFQSYIPNCRKESLSNLLIYCKFAIRKADIAKSKGKLLFNF